MSATTLQELAQAVVDAKAEYMRRALDDEEEDAGYYREWMQAQKRFEKHVSTVFHVPSDDSDAAEFVLAALNTAEARGRASASEDWRPMETAPRDSAQHLLACWEHEDGTRRVLETWWCNTEWYGDNKYGKYTHWKPWPTPPGGKV